MTTKLNHTEALFPTGTWKLDQAQTTVTVTAKKMGFITVPATLTVSAGTIEIDHDHNIVNVEIIADAASYTSSNDKRDKHVRSNDFLDVDNHPTITFRSGKVTVTPDGYHADGSVTLKGQSSPVEVAIANVEFDSRTGSFSASAAIDRNTLGVNKLPSFIVGRMLVLNVAAEATLDNQK
jgi:polyisoprenoid-binding protein YceI